MINRVSGAASSAQLKQAVKRLNDDEVMTILRSLSVNLGRRIDVLQKIATELEAKKNEQLMSACKQQAKPTLVKPIEPISEPSQEMLLDKSQPPPQMIHELMSKRLPGRTISADQM
ncbi:hypothetical protein QR680_016548 [Steinernema hermaphroditum]|uniref:Uncharacterized protein n=1 Tax=Steinernema hermaphroditum TaxID=289476 RepID=A0AA39HBX0_9BILA|nr:hypothetical protein QR680_016548 [Steinernema hermaphroditum]